MKAWMVSGVILACSVLACAQDSTKMPVVQAPAASLAPVRIILQFKSPTAYQSDAVLHTLQTQTQAQVRYITSVSRDTHVYHFQPAAGHTYAQLLERLSSLPMVARVEIDQKITID